MKSIISIVYFLFLSIYIFLLYSIHSQVNKYLLPRDKQSKNILTLLMLGAVVLILISIFLFFLIPWKSYVFNLNLSNIIDFLRQTGIPKK